MSASETGTQVIVVSRRGRWEVTAKDGKKTLASFPASQKDEAVDFARTHARRLRENASDR